MIFARGISDRLTGLVKKLDAATAANKRLGTFVVFLSDDPGIAENLIGLAKKEKIDNTVLAFLDAAGPEVYAVAKDADVTVVLYTGFKVKANHAFKKGKMGAEDIDRIMA